MDKWVIQKNNKGWDRHKVYVAFVVLYYQKNGRYPTESEYLIDIVSYLVSVGVNKHGKKTAENHQLYSPVFYGFLKYNEDKIEPTDIGLIILLDSANLFRNEATFVMYMKYTTLGNEASGSDLKYKKIMPLKEVFENLVIHNKISFHDLNDKFTYSIPNTDISSLPTIDDLKKDPKWEYSLKWALEAGLIKSDGNLSVISRKNKNYTSSSNIYPTLLLKSYISDIDSIKKKLFLRFNIDEKEININNIIKMIKPLDVTKEKGRLGTLQQAFRQSLIQRDKKCIICGIEHPLVLTASHIFSYELCNEEQQFDINNGLLLCDIHDSLFDSGLMTFIDGELVFSNELSNNDKQTIELLPHISTYNFSESVEKYMRLRNIYEFEKFKSCIWSKRSEYKKKLK